MVKPTRIEITGNGDAELLDYALIWTCFGEVERRPRLFNFRRWEHLQLTLTLNNNANVVQPFHADYARNAAGNLMVTTSQPVYATAMIEAAGFQVASVEKGDNTELACGMKFEFSCQLNGRVLAVSIDTSEK